jgi:hypothetical protein
MISIFELWQSQIEVFEMAAVTGGFDSAQPYWNQTS